MDWGALAMDAAGLAVLLDAKPGGSIVCMCMGLGWATTRDAGRGRVYGVLESSLMR